MIADDFTGASDIALTLAEAGMPVAQFIGIPSGSADPDLGAGVVALKSRTAPVDEAIEASMAACDWLLAQGAEQIILKVCSTFDSTERGNIGPVLDALAARVGAGPVIVCPAFPENGRSVYMGHLFVGDRLLNESGMEDHPLTPMRDADIRRVLGAQSKRVIAHVPAATVRQGDAAIVEALAGDAHVVVDAIADEDLIRIGGAAAGLPLLCGGSGIALGLPGNYGFEASTPTWEPVDGPGAVISGSCSRATRAQVAEYLQKAPARQIEARQAVEGAYDPDAIADWVLAQDVAPLVYSSADPDVVRAAQETFGTEKVAGAIEGLFAALARRLAARGVRRLVVAGGETSGAVVRGLGARELQIGPRAAAGVPLMRSGDLALALKSGNFGGPAFFAETLSLMETGR
ncbi:3-oxo-tetronate kinase [Amaricoccus tamworthensis]|uniref:3-oxo-tetronate kinase n=1 Tax=Amaricoccus tamworthensis TaxID=57002 RepID=UPI003C79F67A